MSKTKKPNQHLKPKRGLGSAVTRQRRKVVDTIDKERKYRAEQQRNDARNALHLAKRFDEDREERALNMWRQAFVASIANQQTAVLRSYGMTHPVRAKLHHRYYHPNRYDPDSKLIDSAYTDFEQVVLNISPPGIPEQSDYANVIDTIASLRGVFQHEFGHLRYTTPFPHLISEFRDSPNSAGYLHHVTDPSKLKWAWNALEDQRMESLCVRSVPRLATYFTSMILKVILNEDNPQLSWLLLAGRTYLPDDVRYYSRDAFASRALADEWYDIVKSYKTATTSTDMVLAVIRASQFMEANQLAQQDTGSSHRDAQPSFVPDPDNISSGGEELQDEQDSLESFTPGTNGQSGDKNESGDVESDSSGNDTDNDGDDTDTDSGTASDGDGDGDSLDNDKPEDTPQSGSSNADSTNDNDTPHTAHVPSVMEEGHAPTPTQSAESGDGNFKHSVEQQLEQALNELRNDRDVHDAARQINHDFSHSHIPTLSTSDMPMLRDEHQQTAVMLSSGIENALSDYVTASQPHWVDRVDHGIISPLAFRTKDVGSYDYRRDRIGDCVDGLDLHVSFLSDVSVSMEGGPMTALSIAMYAMVNACQRLGIGTTCTLWSSSNETYRIWDDEQPTPVLMGALGGTDPTSALDDLATHNPEDAGQHLVFIFTDGEWGYMPRLSDTYGDINRRIVVVRYSSWYENGVELDTTYYSDALINISDITKMPEVLQDCIADILSTTLDTH